LRKACLGLKEGGIPIGAAIFNQTGKLSALVTIAACSKAIRPYMERQMRSETQAGKKLPQAGHGDDARALLVLQWSGAPVWIWHPGSWGEQELSGWDRLVAFFGVQVIDLDSQECVSLLADYIRAYPTVWNEDIAKNRPSAASVDAALFGAPRNKPC